VPAIARGAVVGLDVWMFVLLIVALVTGLVVPARPAQAWCQMKSSTGASGQAGVSQDCVAGGSGVPIAWRRRCTSYALYEGDSRTMSRAQIVSALNSAFSAWMNVKCAGNRPIGLQVRALPEPSQCDQAEYNIDGPNQNTVVFVDDWAARCVYASDGSTVCYDPKAFAVTTVWHNKNTGEIFDVDIEINENRGPYGVCPAEPNRCTDRRTVDLQNVLTHEVGHYFGLGHPPASQAGATQTTMYGDSQPGETSKRSLDADDVAGLCAMYPDLDVNETCDDTPAGGLSLQCYQPSSGCSVAPTQWLRAPLHESASATAGRGPGAWWWVLLGGVVVWIRGGRRRYLGRYLRGSRRTGGDTTPPSRG
jgi:hypothetical protein